MRQRLVISSIIIGSCCGVDAAAAQILPDGTTNTSVVNNCQSACEITGGIRANQNLFHSFHEFNIPPGGSAYFINPGVDKILSRITGGNPSEIFGTLGISGGNADLFLLNPNGIIFGAGAALDLNGSFSATTADEIKFGQQGSFSAIPQQQEDLALLTVNPSALWFEQVEPNGSIILDQATLNLAEKQDLSLIAQARDRPGITINNSVVNVSAGNINLGVVRNQGEITISENSELEFGNVSRGDITITNNSQIEIFNPNQTNNSIANKISLESDNLEITGNSVISSLNDGNRGADININAQSSAKIIGTDDAAFQQFILDAFTPKKAAVLHNGLQTITFGTGDAGDIKITTADLIIDRGAGIVSATNDLGMSGDLDLEVTGNFTLRSSGILTGSDISSLGHVGKINVKTKQLRVTQNSIISSSTPGKGDAGKMNIEASEVIEIKDTLADAILPTGVFSNTVFGNGKGGNIKIKTPRLILQNGGQLSASSGTVVNIAGDLNTISSGGQGGSIELEISDSIEVEGRSIDGRFPSSILSETYSSSPAGSLKIDTGNLWIDSDGFISTSSLADGAGGNILINASKSINVDGPGVDNLEQLIFDGLQGKLNSANIKGGIAAFTLDSGRSGKITITTPSLDLDQGAIITTATYGENDAGDLTIHATEDINLTSSAIVSPTFGAGAGGRIELKSKNLNITKGGAVASASLASGRAGDIDIVATESISIFDIIPGLLFSGSISTGNYSGFSLSGNLSLSTKRLTIKDGANIETNNVFLVPNLATGITDPRIVEQVNDNVQGQLTINASESIEINGSIANSNQYDNHSASHISSVSDTLNPASNIVINTGKLSLYNHGVINVSSLGAASAGKLIINADSISLNHEAQLSGTTRSGQGGNIDLEVEKLLQIDDRSLIDTNAIAEGNGGNINIKADFVIARSQSAIAANAKQEGKGGSISITAKDVFLSADSSITANSALGIDGTVEVTTLVDTERNNLTQLPQHVIQADSRIVKSCGNQENRHGIFTYTGKGGLPHNPFVDFQAGSLLIADLDAINNSAPNEQFSIHNKTLEVIQPILAEANQWRVNNQGKVELVAHNSRSLLQEFNPLRCLAQS